MSFYNRLLRAGLCLFFALSLPACRVSDYDSASNAPLELEDTGFNGMIDYRSYGKFKNIGSEKYKFSTDDKEALIRASGEGVYPNQSVQKKREFAQFKKKYEKKLDPWSFVDSGSAKDDYYAWSVTRMYEEGVKLFFRADALRRAGYIVQALKAYYAIIVYFPKTVIWAADGSFYWYVAPEAISRIRKICATYPDLGFQLEGAFVEVDWSPQRKPLFDKVRVWPGQFVKVDWASRDRGPLRVTKRRGNGRVKLIQYNGRYWRLVVDGRPFLVKGVTYSSTTVGETPHALNLRPWMRLDDNENGRHDGMFDSWVDANRNNKQDPDEPVVGDAKLLKEMGANTIRTYHTVDQFGFYDPTEYDKELLRKLNREYGIYFLMGDFLGAYTIGSQARWEDGTDYTDPVQRRRMLDVVRDMVLDHKDEPYVLMWLLGNENQHPYTHTNANEHPKVYAKFLNEVAEMIHDIDPDHPVAVGNLNISGVRELAEFAPAIDVYGANVYSGAYSLGSVWQAVKHYYDRPVLITEMGCDAYAEGKGLDEASQAEYFRMNWEDVVLNAEGGNGEGNAIGAIVFEWMDEWWKTSKGDSWGDPKDHNTEGDFRSAAPDGWMHEEWLGIFGQGDGSQSHFLREPRKVYRAIQEAWTAG